MKIAVIGNFPPRKCGIATYTENFVESLFAAENNQLRFELEVEVIAMNENGNAYKYPAIVSKTINQESIEDYNAVIDYINSSGFDYCHIQHEYGIFGGESGLFVLRFLAQLKVPIGVTLHSVLKSPNYYQRQIIYAFGVAASKIFVMNPMATTILTSVYGVAEAKISCIEHGVPVFLPYDKSKAKRKMAWDKHKVLMTFGLLGRSKGIEVVIKAMPEICARFPDFIYVVLGKLHPHVIEHEGYSYIDGLKKLAKYLKVESQILFIDEFVLEEELQVYLKACDVYVTPYLNEAQITSGTLSYALSSGAAMVSTPYWHALELLKEGRGQLFDFGNSQQLASILIELFSNSQVLKEYQQRAFDYGQTISWPKIGKAHLIEIHQLIEHWKNKNRSIDQVLIHYLPEFSLTHLNRLTDSTGILQHARFIFPNFNHGYTTDDNARALLMSMMYYRYNPTDEAKALFHKFLSFLNYMQLSDGRFLNYLSYSRTIENKEFSEDAFGRTLWALGYTMRFAPESMCFEFAKELFLKSLTTIKELKSLRGMANALIGMSHYLKIIPHDVEILELLKSLSRKIEKAFTQNWDEDWVWFEDTLSYDNAVIPLALLSASEFDEQQKYFDIATKSMAFLERITLKDSRFSLVGNQHWVKRGERKADFSQQPLDALMLVLYYAKAYELTKDENAKKKQQIAFSWFLGNNDVFIPLYDDQTKACADGLFEKGVNRNQGAESLLAWLISYLSFKLIDSPV